jgi:hypothetical protein
MTTCPNASDGHLVRPRPHQMVVNDAAPVRARPRRILSLVQTGKAAEFFSSAVVHAPRLMGDRSPDKCRKVLGHARKGAGAIGFHHSTVSD